MFSLIAFDADDTLWHNERLYHQGRERFRQILAKYGINAIDDARVDAVELRNLPYYGYGVMSFILSLIEAGIELTSGRLRSEDVQALLDMGKEMLRAVIEVYDGVAETLAALSAELPLMLITKGDLFHQQFKIAASGLEGFFEFVEVVSQKDLATYSDILEHRGIDAKNFLMVGNSMRSDVLPVLELGGWGVLVPNELSWTHEDGDPPTEASERYFELERLDQLPELLTRLKSDSFNPL